MKLRWFMFFFRRSVTLRKGRLAIAALAVMLAVTIITAMVCVTYGIRSKLGEELKSYGANVIVSPGPGARPLTVDALRKLASVNGVKDVTGQFLASAVLKGHSIEIIGMDIDRLKTIGWRQSGKWPAQSNELLAGALLSSIMKTSPENRITLNYEKTAKDYKVTGFIEKGGPEDRALIMSLESAWDLTGSRGQLNSVLARVPSDSLDEYSRLLQNAVPGASVKTVRQVALAEESLLRKMQLLMGMVTAVVLAASVITVTSTMGATVLERRAEIGLMKALGATKHEVGVFFLAEAFLTGIMGGIAGCLAGIAVAEAVSKGAFSSLIPAPFYIPFMSVAIGMAIALASSYFPVSDAVRSVPAVILREG